MRGDVQSAEWRSLWLFARARRATGHVVAIMAVAILSTLISTVAVPAAQDFGDNLAYGYLYYPLLTGPIFTSALFSRIRWAEPFRSREALSLDFRYRLAITVLCLAGSLPSAIASGAHHAWLVSLSNTAVMLILCLALTCCMSTHWAWLPPLAYGLIGMTIPPMPWFLISLSASGAKLLMALLLLPVVIVAVALYSHYVSRVRLSA